MIGWPSAHYGKIRSLLLGLGWHEDPAAPEPQPFLSLDGKWCVMFEKEKWFLAEHVDWECQLVERASGVSRDELLRALEEQGLMPISEEGCDILELAKGVSE